jgi:integration host factor subunit beta
MTKSELVNRLHAKNSRLRHHDVENLVTAFFLIIRAALVRSLRIEMRGFGVFGLRQRKARIGRNPRTGEMVRVAEKQTPYFKAGKDLREKVNTLSQRIS